jgi:hypothetical protein
MPATTDAATTPALARCLRCGDVPKAQRVRVPHLTWAVYCQCGRQTDYYAAGKTFAARAWNAQNAELTGRID